MFLFQNFFAYKYHWSESRVSVVLQVGPHALLQVDPSSQRVLSAIPYKDLAAVVEVRHFCLIIGKEPFFSL